MRPEDRPFPPHVAAHVLYHFGAPGGYPAGSFVTALVDLMSRADPENLARLTFGFPEYGHAVRVAQSGPGDRTNAGIAFLREILATSEDPL